MTIPAAADVADNEDNGPAANAADAPLISTAGCPVVVGVEPTNEEWVAARSALSVLASSAHGPSPALLPMHEES